MKTYKIALIAACAATLAACSSTDKQSADIYLSAEKAVASSFQNMQPGWDKRLVQDQSQKMCTAARDKPSKAEGEFIEKLNQSFKVQYPSDGKLIGDWKKGESIAQNGYGMRVGDNNPKRENGGNCYACHQIQKKELSFGTMGPTLAGYGKVRGNSDAIVKYTYDKIYNAQAFSACSNMPRFGHNGILSPNQISHLVALLLDPESPVNQ